MATKWWQDGDNSASMMRIGAMVAIIMGCLMIVSGIVMAIIMLIYERYSLVSFITILITTGPGMITLSLGAKAWQAQKEDA